MCRTCARATGALDECHCLRQPGTCRSVSAQTRRDIFGGSDVGAASATTALAVCAEGGMAVDPFTCDRSWTGSAGFHFPSPAVEPRSPAPKWLFVFPAQTPFWYRAAHRHYNRGPDFSVRFLCVPHSVALPQNPPAETSAEACLGRPAGPIGAFASGGGAFSGVAPVPGPAEPVAGWQTLPLRVASQWLFALRLRDPPIESRIW
mmetsp:Transcript_63667/g.106201  ORF Transcript_63667/g.106201 Transcript_63667/m.106201 type:complete len:204 (-) Transcript_63667:45-656(-)